MKLASLNIFIFFLTIQVGRSNGYNILGIFTSTSPSHLIVHMSMVKALAEKGHNVTVISALKPKVNHDRINVIVIPPSAQTLEKIDGFLSNLGKKETSFFEMMKNIASGALQTIFELQYEIMKSDKFQQFLSTPDTSFDLMVLGYFMNDFQLGVAAKYKCPVVIDWSGPPMYLINRFIGNPLEIAYVPNMNMAVKTGMSLTFVQRVQNICESVFMTILGQVFHSKSQKCYDELFSDLPHAPTLNEMHKNISLVFVNNHFSEGPIRPNVPALIEIGGIQVKEQPDPLPKDIADFLDASKDNGAVLFSLGSNLKGSTLEPEIIKSMFNAISSLKQNVIWKWEDLKNVPGKSKNILYKTWMPQDDILAHPNIKLFITHAGKGGIVEAQYHGVPMVAIPFFADQQGNAAKITEAGFGITQKITELTEQKFRDTLLEVLQNPKYTENAKQFSVVYRDRPHSAKESVVYWTEYVIRHHGAAHMQSGLVHLNVFQSNSLDVIAFFFAIIYVALRIIKLSIKLIKKSLPKIFSRSKKIKKN